MIRNAFSRFAAVWMLCACCMLSPPLAAADSAPPDLSDLAWLEGHWTGTQGRTLSEEFWSSPAGGGMVGMHKDVRGGKMVAFEFLRIGAQGDSVCYFASPGGAPPTTFCQIERGERRVVFENLRHDFPQRVMYWLDDDGRLHARIEGDRGGRLESAEWTWERAPAARK